MKTEQEINDKIKELVEQKKKADLYATYNTKIAIKYKIKALLWVLR